jgi:(1->4)-alpha-D-glucan 1-alpha-D-glucosylmutase
MTLPRATYRLQLRGGVGFEAAAGLVPYLARLGVSHLYLSPILTAREGSSHGYDAVDFNEIDPALGGQAGFERLGEVLRAHGLGLLLDFVPNHMGIGAGNHWWQEQLREGRRAPPRFDIDWQALAGATPGRVLLPVLGEPYGSVLASGDLRLLLDEAGGLPAAGYFDHRFPLDPETFGLIDPELPALLGMAPRPEARIRALLDAASEPSRLHPILEAQPWRLAHWRAAAHLLNYRRFFDITDLVGVRMEDPAVFDASHALILDLVARGRLQGIRLDHIDGLRDPALYLDRLQAALRRATGRDEPFWVLVEKILGPGEVLPSSWPVSGTTGYEVLGTLAAPFLDPSGLERLGRLYQEVTGDGRDFARIAREAKRLVLERLFPGELRRLVQQASALAGQDLASRDLPPGVLREAIIAYIVALPVYRTYVDAKGADAADRERIRVALAVADAGDTVEDPQAFPFLESLLAGDHEGALDFAMRLQQLSGPAMAKALEDTAFYRWHRLVALNEVGGEPGDPPMGVEAFHAANAERLLRTPLALLAGTTHDTKRGEDVRARLLVLSELPEAWAAAVAAWRELNAPLRGELAGRPVPRAPVEYLVYQTLAGCWPFSLQSDDAAGLGDLADRLVAYLLKALREAKERTRWTAPDDDYEQAMERFARRLLDPAENPRFLADMAAFVARIAAAGALNGLAQTLLRLTMPGVPDIYQGSELWELSLVDPDNRRPVDFAALAANLDDPTPLPDLLAHWRDGRVKQALIRTALAFRAADPGLFAGGDYLPLAAEGDRAANIVAFARLHEGRAALTLVPRATARLTGPDLPMPNPETWSTTRLRLPESLAGRDWRNLLDGEAIRAEEPGTLPLTSLLSRFPLALLQAS